MQSALHIKSKVLPGNKLEIDIPDGAVGDSVDVFIILPQKTEPKQVSVIELLEKVHSQRAPRTAEEIDRELQEEKNSWDS
ncbi:MULTISPECIES: hypothetical protein [Kamptonema]|uniref:hypothetical protein n=1 Tax=Kamptonema TaxID=1501433 RepID=UPI0001DAC469|nr:MULTISPECIES: hypothetical protein [Kamptonema]CBN57917.1 conserved hypothetical protein [Kamptonema sp. PCC 6506]